MPVYGMYNVQNNTVSGWLSELLKPNATMDGIISLSAMLPWRTRLLEIVRMYPMNSVTGVLYLPSQHSTDFAQVTTKFLRVCRLELWLSRVAMIVTAIVNLLLTRTVFFESVVLLRNVLKQCKSCYFHRTTNAKSFIIGSTW